MQIIVSQPNHKPQKLHWDSLGKITETGPKALPFFPIKAMHTQRHTFESTGYLAYWLARAKFHPARNSSGSVSLPAPVLYMGALDKYFISGLQVARAAVPTSRLGQCRGSHACGCVPSLQSSLHSQLIVARIDRNTTRTYTGHATVSTSTQAPVLSRHAIMYIHTPLIRSVVSPAVHADTATERHRQGVFWSGKIPEFAANGPSCKASLHLCLSISLCFTSCTALKEANKKCFASWCSSLFDIAALLSH